MTNRAIHQAKEKIAQTNSNKQKERQMIAACINIAKN